MPITIKETIVGCGAQWYHRDVIDRDRWLREHMKNGREPFLPLENKDYAVWYGGLESDDRYIIFNNEEDALAYTIRWKIR